MTRGRPKKGDDSDEKVLLHQRFWIWDSVWEEPREVDFLVSKEVRTGRWENVTIYKKD